MHWIYSYTDCSKFINDSYNEKKRRNCQFSIRAWAMQLGMKAHGPLHQMMNGKRKIPRNLVPLFAKNLGLNKKEGQFLFCLVDLSRAKNIEERTLCLEKMSSMAKDSGIKYQEVDSFYAIRDPLHSFMSEMTVLKNCPKVEDMNPIRNRLRHTRSLKEIDKTIGRLIELGMLVHKEDGNIIKSERHFFSKSDIVDQGLQEYHKCLCDLAKKAIDTQTVGEREFNGVAMNIKTRDLQKAKDLIREFRQRFIQEIEAADFEGEETYQLNLQFFSVIKGETL